MDTDKSMKWLTEVINVTLVQKVVSSRIARSQISIEPATFNRSKDPLRSSVGSYYFSFPYI